MSTPEEGVGDLADALNRTQLAEARAIRAESQLCSATHQGRVDSYRVPKIPGFFRSDPELWFLQAESTLRNARITAECTKADAILAELDIEIVSCVKDIISMSSPPPRYLPAYQIANHFYVRSLR